MWLRIDLLGSILGRGEHLSVIRKVRVVPHGGLPNNGDLVLVVS